MFKFKLVTLLAVFLVPGILVCTWAAERREVMPFIEFGEPSTATRSAVFELVDAFKSTWAAQDTAGHLELFSSDAEWINAYARMFRGIEELQVFLRDRLFPNFDSVVSQEEIRNAQTLSIRYLNDDAAVIHVYTDGRRGPSAIEGEQMRRTHIHLVVAKNADQWQIVHTAIMDARE